MIREIFRMGRIQYGPKSELGPRDTIGFEFVRILKGHVVWTFDGKSYEAKPGTFILSRPEHFEHYRWDTHGITQHDFVHFYLEELPIGFPPVQEWSLIEWIPAQNILHHLFQYVVFLNRSAHPQRFDLMKSIVEQMLYAWVLRIKDDEDLGIKDFPTPIQRVLDKALDEWRHNNYGPYSLDELVLWSKVSRSSFIRAFKIEFGLSPTRFFEYQRLYLGRLFLQESNYNVEEISRKLGYQNPFHFSKNFKQLFKMAPREFRQHAEVEIQHHDNYIFQKIFNALSSTQII